MAGAATTSSARDSPMVRRIRIRRRLPIVARSRPCGEPARRAVSLTEGTMSVYSPGWRGGHPGWAGKVQADLSQLLGGLSTPAFMKCRPWSKSASNLPSSWTIQCLYQLVNNQTDLFFDAGVDGSIVYKTSKLY